MLPEGAKVWEWQAETKIVPDGIHVAGAAGLEYWTQLVARG